MKLSNNDQLIINALREKNLNYLIQPFLRLVELNKLGHIHVHKMTWKVIMREVRNPFLTKSDLEQLIVSHLVSFQIFPTVVRKRDKRSSKDRVKSYRLAKKELGYTQLSVLVSEDDLARLKRFKHDRGMTYQEVFSFMIANLPVNVESKRFLKQ